MSMMLTSCIKVVNCFLEPACQSLAQSRSHSMTCGVLSEKRTAPRKPLSMLVMTNLFVGSAYQAAKMPRASAP